MMQDTVLNICRDSVKEFVHYILEFCPEETEIINTNLVRNKFNKKMIGPEDSEYEEEPYKEIKEDDCNHVQETMKWLHKMYDKNKDPDPLFVMNLVASKDSVYPTYTTHPDEVVKRVNLVFDQGIKVLSEIPQLEPILLKNLFKISNKCVKSP
jgi:hypothetical protein